MWPQVRDLIVGPPGSVVVLSVDRKMGDKEEIFDVELTRAEIVPRDRYTWSYPKGLGFEV